PVSLRSGQGGLADATMRKGGPARCSGWNTLQINILPKPIGSESIQCQRVGRGAWRGTHGLGRMLWLTGTGARIGAAAAIASLLLCACTHERKGPVGQHYVDFSTRPPRNN